jgi:hypothetical protein
MAKEYEIPNTDLWQPKTGTAEILHNIFFRSCVSIEKIIKQKISYEKEVGIYNFSSGISIEEILREEISKILPKRYTTTTSIISDKYGHTAGEVDMAIFNDLWFPKLKIGDEKLSKKSYLPIESIYAVGEIKQTLDFKTLDEACEKLVMCHRLDRPFTKNFRIVENRQKEYPEQHISNPLYSFILATDIGKNCSMQDLIERFYDINKTLKRLEVIRCLCVLEKGTVLWSYFDESANELKPALFMSNDLYEKIIPVYAECTEGESALFNLLINLNLHLYHSVLMPEDLLPSYSYDLSKMPFIKVPTNREICLNPDLLDG